MNLEIQQNQVQAAADKTHPAASAAAKPAMAQESAAPVQPADARYKDWAFGELPELMEIAKIWATDWLSGADQW